MKDTFNFLEREKALIENSNQPINILKNKEELEREIYSTIKNVHKGIVDKSKLFVDLHNQGLIPTERISYLDNGKKRSIAIEDNTNSSKPHYFLDFRVTKNLLKFYITSGKFDFLKAGIRGYRGHTEINSNRIAWGDYLTPKELSKKLTQGFATSNDKGFSQKLLFQNLIDANNNLYIFLNEINKNLDYAKGLSFE